MANLRRIGMTYYVRFIIPKDRWDDCEGKREVVRTLQTRDLKEARKRRSHALEAIKAQLNDELAGRGLKSLDAQWTPDWQTRALEDNAKVRLAVKDDDYEEADGTYYPSSHYRETFKVLENAEVLDEKYGSAVAKSYYNTAMGDSTPLSVLADRWLASEASKLRGQTIDHHRSALKAFGAFLGEDKGFDSAQALKSTGIESITADRAAEFLEWLEQTKKLHPRSCARNHSSLSVFWRWAMSRKLVKENVWLGLASGFKKKAKKIARIEGQSKRPYTPAEIVTLLRANPSEGRRWTYGTAIFDLVRLGLLTGARANELCSLRRKDITRNGTGMLVDPAIAKTDNAIREIPLHPMAQAIIAARLADIAANQQPEAPLFPDLPVGGPDKKRSWKFSPKYSEWRQSVLGAGREVDFHSFRRCFATFWEHAQANGGTACTDLVRKDVMGHARQDVTAGYVGRNLGWETYTRGIEAMVTFGLPDEIRQALEDTKDLRPPVSQQWGKRSHN